MAKRGRPKGRKKVGASLSLSREVRTWLRDQDNASRVAERALRKAMEEERCK